VPPLSRLFALTEYAAENNLIILRSSIPLCLLKNKGLKVRRPIKNKTKLKRKGRRVLNILCSYLYLFDFEI
jgi:hypothetical protein